jgi:AcrR family transcriptional regulator
MRTATASRPTRETYRHGNVRAEAIAAAYAQIAAQGHEGLSLRRVAESVGIAHRSLYNHFADRDALLDAVAEVGFIELAAALRPARSPKAFVRAYIVFALRSPRLHALMLSRPHATMKRKPALQRAVHLGITEAMRLFGRGGRTSAQRRRAVMKVLFLLHGGISLHAGGILDVRGDEGLIAELQAMVAAG